jgi:hypothetical protein
MSPRPRGTVRCAQPEPRLPFGGPYTGVTVLYSFTSWSMCHPVQPVDLVEGQPKYLALPQPKVAARIRHCLVPAGQLAAEVSTCPAVHGTETNTIVKSGDPGLRNALEALALVRRHTGASSPSVPLILPKVLQWLLFVIISSHKEMHFL